jgi:hypothetical protein
MIECINRTHRRHAEQPLGRLRSSPSPNRPRSGHTICRHALALNSNVGVGWNRHCPLPARVQQMPSRAHLVVILAHAHFFGLHFRRIGQGCREPVSVIVCACVLNLLIQ